MPRFTSSQFVVAAAPILHECMTGRHGSRRLQSLQSAHGTQSSLQLTVIGFDRVIGVLLDNMQRSRQLFLEDPRVGVSPVGRHLDPTDTDGQRPSEEPPGCGQIAADAEHDVDDLAVLVDRPVQVGPAAGDPDVGLVDEPAVTGQPAARAGGFDELGGEPLDPPVDGYVVNADAAFGEQFLDVAVGQAVSQIPADRDRDHLTRETESGECRRAPRGHRPSLADASIDQRNGASGPALGIRADRAGGWEPSSRLLRSQPRRATSWFPMVVRQLVERSTHGV